MSETVSAQRLNHVTSTIIEAAIRIHHAIGPGLLESAYFGCLCFELRSSELRIETQKALPLVYRGTRIDCAYRADLIVDGAGLRLPSAGRLNRSNLELCGLCVETSAVSVSPVRRGEPPAP